MTTQYSEIKRLKEFCSDTVIVEDWREVVEQMEAGTDDFEVNDHRFIKAGKIDAIQQEELSWDEYVLGCFNADFLAGILQAPTEVIKKMQEAEAFEAIGHWVISLGKIDDLQREYANTDGYGHHFAHYDHEEHELTLDAYGTYLVFRTN